MNSLWTWKAFAVAVFGAEAVRDATDHPRILHFEGPSLAKPWHYLCDHPFRTQYRSTHSRTPWSGAPIEGRTVPARLIALLPSRLRRPAFVKLSDARARMRSIRTRLQSQLTLTGRRQ